jgi:hypothetical protein
MNATTMTNAIIPFFLFCQVEFQFAKWEILISVSLLLIVSFQEYGFADWLITTWNN